MRIEKKYILKIAVLVFVFVFFLVSASVAELVNSALYNQNIIYRSSVMPNSNSFNLIDDNNPVLIEYKSKHEKYIKNANKTARNYVPDDFQFNNEIMRISLQDGDYLKFFKNKSSISKMFYAFEYHADDTYMGRIDIKPIKKKGDVVNFVAYEYRKVDIDTYKQLKHIIFFDYDYDKDNLIALFIYREDGYLLCYQLDNIVYLSAERKNLIPQLQNVTIGEPSKFFGTDQEENNKEAVGDFALNAANKVGMFTIGLPVTLFYAYIYAGDKIDKALSKDK